ncbi:MAG TPA: zinc ribbon domain-containing protein [Candidatus Acidoferrales bacterium]|nr:zinc ribbon domain-containing protein [Candidatus Acidoferrales bacterium]
MPIYEYRCRRCATDFEYFLLSSQETVACPKCQGQEVERKLSVFSSPSAGGEPRSAASGGGCGCTPQTCGCH